MNTRRSFLTRVADILKGIVIGEFIGEIAIQAMRDPRPALPPGFVYPEGPVFELYAHQEFGMAICNRNLLDAEF
jgi:hypothetical protein